MTVALDKAPALSPRATFIPQPFPDPQDPDQPGTPPIEDPMPPTPPIPDPEPPPAFQTAEATKRLDPLTQREAPW